MVWCGAKFWQDYVMSWGLHSWIYKYPATKNVLKITNSFNSKHNLLNYIYTLPYMHIYTRTSCCANKNYLHHPFGDDFPHFRCDILLSAKVRHMIAAVFFFGLEQIR